MLEWSANVLKNITMAEPNNNLKTLKCLKSTNTQI